MGVRFPGSCKGVDKMMPANSLPAIHGKGGWCWYLPVVVEISLILEQEDCQQSHTAYLEGIVEVCCARMNRYQILF